MQWGAVGPGKLGPDSASVKTYILGSSRTPRKLASFPDLCNMEDCDTLDSGFYIPPQFSHFRILCLLNWKIFLNIESLS